MRSVVVLALVLSGSLAYGPARAKPRDGDAPKPDVHIFNYGQTNPACQRWSDGCRTCTREGCSNIGPACQPTELKCIEPIDLPEKGK